MRHGNLGALLLVVVLALSSDAWGQATDEDVAYSFMLVALPVADSTVFIGGVSAALAGTVNLADGRSSAGWRTANYAFGGLNSASTLGYVIAMGSVRGIWPYLLWPMLAHAGLATANFIIGYKVGPARVQRVTRLSITPLASIDRASGAYAGIGAVLTHF